MNDVQFDDCTGAFACRQRAYDRCTINLESRETWGHPTRQTELRAIQTAGPAPKHAPGYVLEVASEALMAKTPSVRHNSPLQSPKTRSPEPGSAQRPTRTKPRGEVDARVRTRRDALSPFGLRAEPRTTHFPHSGYVFSRSGARQALGRHVKPRVGVLETKCDSQST